MQFEDKLNIVTFDKISLKVVTDSIMRKSVKYVIIQALVLKLKFV